MPFGFFDLLLMMIIFGGIGWAADRKFGTVCGILFGIAIFAKIAAEDAF